MRRSAFGHSAARIATVRIEPAPHVRLHLASARGEFRFKYVTVIYPSIDDRG